MSGPTAHRVELPTDGRLPVVGKVRLGTMQERQKDGKTVTFPKAADYFVVVEDDSTPALAAASFHEVYGEQPKALACVLPAAATDECLQGSYRLYGTGAKLKRICSGTTCDEKSSTGAWVEKPCVCKALNLPEKHADRCSLTYTLQVLLPDVRGVGVWQVDTGSEISARNLTAWLQLTEQLRGTLLMAPFTLRLKPIHGRQGTVYVLDPEVLLDETPRQAITAAEERRALLAEGARPELPAPVADTNAEPTLDPHRLRDAPRRDDGPSHTPPSEEPAPGGETLTDAVKRQLDDDPGLKGPLGEACVSEGVVPSPKGVAERWGESARDLPGLLERLGYSKMAAGEQASIT